MYITKKQLEKEIMETARDFNKIKSFKPILFILVAMGISISLLCLIPVVLVWVILWVIYIPLHILDSLIIKLWRKYNG